MINTALILASGAVLLILCEIAYRGYVSLKKPTFVLSSVPGVEVELNPGGREIRYNRENVPVETLINSAGFRDETTGEWAGWGPEDIKVAFLGDSLSFGYGVEIDRTFGKIAEKTLNREGWPVKTINSGVPASNTRHHLALVEHKILPVKPDILILGYCLNDIERPLTNRVQSFLEPLLRNFHFGVFLMKRVGTFLYNRRLNEGKGSRGVTSPAGHCSGYEEMIIGGYDTPAWQNSREAIETMAELARAGGIRFGVVYFPFENQLDGSCSDSPQRELSRFCSDRNIPCLDLLEIYRRAGEKVYIEGDYVHPNDRGHQLGGEAVGRWLAADPAFGELFHEE